MTVLLSKTYSEITPESAEDGDTSDEGFVWLHVAHTFRELIEVLREHRNASSSGETSSGTWFSCDWYTDCYETGTERQTSIHYSRDNEPRSLKYWLKAINYASKQP